MEFGIMFFASVDQAGTEDRYYLLKKAAVFADQHDFCCVWTPERHFHDFGGLFPNPSVLSAALAMITQRIQLRAGSLISPLHNPIRIAEEWSVGDNLSSGRVAISFGSGWNIDDFIFFPDRYEQRQAVMYEQIAAVQQLWRGEQLQMANPQGKQIAVRLFPRPVQPELPVWVTSSGNVDTFRSAGAIGANVLTHLLGQDIEALEQKIAAYRDARQTHGHDPGAGKVSLMLHTYLGDDLEQVKADVKLPFREYVRSAVTLEQKSARGGGVISGGRTVQCEDIAANDMEDLLDVAFERYFKTAALMGTPVSCLDLVLRLKEIGVDEIACLIDFGVQAEKVLVSLNYLNELHRKCSSHDSEQVVEDSLQRFTGSLTA
jgi:natural product biosynthesis luciferase-like monooxygenase protein